MRRILIGLAVAFSVSCGGSGIVGSSTVHGAYTLQTVNGSPLPYTTAASGTSKTEITDDVITLYEGGTYAESGHSRITVNGQVTNQTNTKSGSYQLLGNSVSLLNNASGQLSFALIDGNTMTIVENGMTSVFTK